MLKSQKKSMPSQKEINSFVKAMRHNDMRVVEEFLKQYPGSINMHDDIIGMTALMWAAWSGRYESVEFLLENGADVEAKDKHGKTPLMWGAGGLNDEGAVDLLLKHGADITATDDAGCTVEDYAAAEGNDALAALLKEPPEKKKLRMEKQKTEKLQKEINDFSPALKRDFRAPHPFKFSGPKP